MPANSLSRLAARVVLVLILAATARVAAPSPAAHADGWDTFNPCNLPGGAYACQKVEEGSKWLYKASGAESVVNSASSAIDFATDPLGYIDERLRTGFQGLFKAFGEELTGKESPAVGAGPTPSGG